MADVTAKTIHTTKPNGGTHAYVIADGVTVYEGMICQLQSGFLNHWDETGSFLGLLTGGDDRANDGVLLGETSDTPPPEGFVDQSGVTITHLDSVGGTPAAANVGDLVYGSTSNTDDFTLTDTTNPPVGYLSRFVSATDVDVTLFTPAEHKAGIADATWNS